ncbi:MAG TPA: DUF6132 family protein [Chitinophagaceae bacterium]|nr:DUF6132 family protein [Chitinophagaceae bacterium]
MKNWIQRNKLMLAGLSVGALAGFLYWNYVGCSTGTCPITSRWPNSTAYGAVMGGLLFSMFKKERPQSGK